MQTIPQEISLAVSPESRFDMIDITRLAAEHLKEDLNRYRRAAYCSFHTTAGYLEQSLCSRLHYNRDRISAYINTFKELFPINADYRHDKMELRSELSDDQKKCEPKNADSHLTFIGSGLKNYVTYRNSPEIPVYFIDLDGVHEFGCRSRKTDVLFYNSEETVYQHTVDVPVSGHPIDSINLRDPRLGYLDKLSYLLKKFEVEKGRVEISLDAGEKHAGLTVNEYETLLMTHDLIEVLKNPLKFMGEKGKYILQNPGKLRSRTREYAKYDFVQVFNELMDAFRISQSMVEKVLAKFIALPAERFLRVKRNVSFMISDEKKDQLAQIVQGTYQSPILVQWNESPKKARRLHLKITRFN